MSDFVVRVEMHGASDADYTKLHRAMERAGYSRYVLGEGGQLFHLPTATYVSSTATVKSAITVRDEVRVIAHGVRENSWILVNRYDDAAWFLLLADAAYAA